MKIGIFDSGIGGLTVFKEISKALPSFEIVYLGDTARLPYGIKSKRTIDHYSIKNIDFLKSLDCEIIVIACNTASSYSARLLKKKYKIPIFDVISSGVTAALRLNPKNLGVIGTNSTIASESYIRTIKRKNPKVRVHSKACPIFVPIIEQGLVNQKYYDKIIYENLKFFINKKIDSLILGCTHYPLIKKNIQSCVGGDVVLIDSASEVAGSLREHLLKHHGNEFKKPDKKRSIFLTDKSEYFQSVVGKIFRKLDFKIKLVDLK